MKSKKFIIVPILLTLFLNLISPPLYALEPTSSQPTPTVVMIPTSTPTSTVAPSPTPTQEPEQKYSFNAVIDKQNVDKKDTFLITISVQNTGNAAIRDFEIRSPLLNTLTDASFSNADPAFNKLLSGNEHPVNFNNRSWIINSFDSGNSRVYKLEYKVAEDINNLNGISSTFSFPASWNDPRGLPSGSNLNFNTYRFDVYIEGVYKGSFDAPLPKVQSKDTPITDIILDQKFTFEGSRTFDTKTITTDNISSFSDFKIETTDVLIEWLEPVDLSGTEVVNALSNLKDNITTASGTVKFQSDALSFLNLPIQITFKADGFISEPRIKIGSQIKPLSESGATWSKSSNIVVIKLNVLADISLVPTIETEKAKIETKSENLTITGQTSNPRADVYYKINDSSDSKRISGVDLSNGNFSFNLANLSGVKQVEIYTVLPNGERASKVIQIEYKGNNINPDKESTEKDNKPDTISLPDNPITIALLIIAISIALVIAGYVYYLYYNRLKKKKANALAKITNNSWLGKELDGQKSDKDFGTANIIESKYKNQKSNEEKNKNKGEVDISIKTSKEK